MKKIKLKIKKEGSTPIGVITLRSYKAGTKILLKEIVQRNTIMVSDGRGLDLLVQRLISNNTYSANINYGAIGTSSTAVTSSDTQLGSETARRPFALTQESGFNTASLQFFFADANLANGTYTEFGTFVDGTASANTGRLFNRALFSVPYVKTTGVDTTVEVSIEFS